MFTLSFRTAKKWKDHRTMMQLPNVKKWLFLIQWRSYATLSRVKGSMILPLTERKMVSTKFWFALKFRLLVISLNKLDHSSFLFPQPMFHSFFPLIFPSSDFFCTHQIQHLFSQILSQQPCQIILYNTRHKQLKSNRFFSKGIIYS